MAKRARNTKARALGGRNAASNAVDPLRTLLSKGASNGSGVAWRARGKPVPLALRELIGIRLLQKLVAEAEVSSTKNKKPSYRYSYYNSRGATYAVLARDYGVSQATISRIKQRLVQHFFSSNSNKSRGDHQQRRHQGRQQQQQQKKEKEKALLQKSITRVEVRLALRDKQRKGGAHRRKVRSRERRIVREALRQDSTLTLGELCDFLFAKTGVRVALSTMCTLVNCELRLTRKRLARGLPKQAMTARNLALRRSFVERYFGATASKRKVGTREERMDQQHWRVRLDSACRGASQCDRDGCRHLLDVRQIFFIDFYFFLMLLALNMNLKELIETILDTKVSQINVEN